MSQTDSMNSYASDFCETSRYVKVLPDRVIKTIEYSGESQTIELALEKAKSAFDEIQSVRAITTVKFLEIQGNRLTIHQSRTHSKRSTNFSDFLYFSSAVMQANRSGWIFGDINYKNVIFDGTGFKVIDFEPFTKVIRNKQVEYQVTPPYFHPIDKLSATVTPLTDRLGLIGLCLRFKLGLRKQKEIFSSNASTLHEIALTEGTLFIEKLHNLDKRAFV